MGWGRWQIPQLASRAKDLKVEKLIGVRGNGWQWLERQAKMNTR